MNHWRFSVAAAQVLCAVAVAMIPLSPARAAPQRLDCSLTDMETKAGDKSDFAAEKRAVSVVFDQQANALTLVQDGSARVLNNVTLSVTSMNGYLDDISVGINAASRDIVLQTYGPNSMRAEFGVCVPSEQPPP
jgi:hypothetical protein